MGMEGQHMGKMSKILIGLFSMICLFVAGLVVGYALVQSGVLDSLPAKAASAPAPSAVQPLKADPNLEPTKLREQRLAHQEELRLERIKRYQEYLATLPTAPGTEIGSFQTSLAGHSAEGRVKNIQLANEKLNGRILMPGEEISFNETLGDSNLPSGGWQLATVIVGKEYQQGYGGGICQVSSTLYNSVLRAGLQVTERYTHSLPVGYVAPGMDATVSYPELDFRFVNSREVPVRIQTYIDKGLVFAKLHALPAPPQ